MTDTFESSVLEELSWRGFVDDTTHDELDAALADDQQVVYCGFDPSGPSLHVGHLVGLLGLAHFYRHGHDPIALVGGATGLIGDPSGKDEERELLDADRLRANLESISGQMRTILGRALDDGAHAHADSDDEHRLEVLDNARWLGEFSYIDFLRDVGKYFRVNKMMNKESVRARLEEREQGISYTEFSYMLIQAYDFLHLFEQHDCRVQIGGTDQWGNITAGTELVRRDRGETVFGLTFPLLTDAEGKKIGKTEGGALFLDPEFTSPYDFYQYWVNVDDRDCSKLLRLFTLLERDQIEELEATIEAGENRGEVQQRLAREVTALVHGEEETEKVIRASEILFGGTIEGLTDEELSSIFSDAPSTEFDRERLEKGELGIVDAFAETGLQRSKGATRRLIKQGGAYLNNERVEDKTKTLGEEDLASETMLVLRSGKKNYHLVRFV